MQATVERSTPRARGRKPVNPDELGANLGRSGDDDPDFAPETPEKPSRRETKPKATGQQTTTIVAQTAKWKPRETPKRVVAPVDADADLKAPLVLTLPPGSPFPNIEQHSAVVEARGHHSAMLQQFHAASEEHASACQALGLAVDHDSEDRELVAGKLLAGGGDLKPIETIEAAARRVKALRAATLGAVESVRAAITKARKEVNQSVIADTLTPAKSRVLAAYLTLLAAVRDQRALVNQARALGFDFGRSGGIFPQDAPLTPSGAANLLDQLVADGSLQAEQVKGLI